MIQAIITIPPYAPFISEVVRHPKVKGIRLNTVMPIKDSIEEVLKRLQYEVQIAGDKELWIDLKCRQLRVQGFWVPPFTEIKISHNIQVSTPVEAILSDGKERVTLVGVERNRLIMLEGPRRVVGPGESINIISKSLSIEGFLTEIDKKYIETCNHIGLNNFMLSFVEKPEDIQELLQLSPNAYIVAKIESIRGVEYVKEIWKRESRLMAARGDLFLELRKPHHIINALETILKKDPKAIVASRFFYSLTNSMEPSCADIGDMDNLMRMGYTTFMFGDEICLNRDSIISGLNLFTAIAEKYEN